VAAVLEVEAVVVEEEAAEAIVYVVEAEVLECAEDEALV
jgi:hypothetical protein